MVASHFIAARVSSETKARLKALAEQRQLSESALLKRLLELTLDGVAEPKLGNLAWARRVSAPPVCISGCGPKISYCWRSGPPPRHGGGDLRFGVGTCASASPDTAPQGRAGGIQAVDRCSLGPRPQHQSDCPHRAAWSLSKQVRVGRT